MSSVFVPDRGDIVWLGFTPQAGHEQSGRRPAVVLSHAVYNAKAGLALVCPVTSQVKGHPFEFALPAGVNVSGVVLVDQIKSLDWNARKADLIGKLPESVTLAILSKVRTLL